MHDNVNAMKHKHMQYLLMTYKQMQPNATKCNTIYEMQENTHTNSHIWKCNETHTAANENNNIQIN